MQAQLSSEQWHGLHRGLALDLLIGLGMPSRYTSPKRSSLRHGGCFEAPLPWTPATCIHRSSCSVTVADPGRLILNAGGLFKWKHGLLPLVPEYAARCL